MSELIDLVGHDVVRFIFLMYSNSTHMEFDLSIAEEKSEKNPVYNVQYVSARMNSILNQIEISESRIGNSKINLDEECEINLVRALLKWPEILEEISTSFMVQLLPKYAIEIANNFHRFYDKCRVISNGKIDPSRVKLLQLTQRIYKEILTTIGISIPDKM